MEVYKHKCILIVIAVSVITFCVLLTAFFVFHNRSVETTSKRLNLVIDQDGGADDAMAIFMALLYEKYFYGPKVIALTTVHGNVDEPQVYINTQIILDVARRRDVPIYRGSKSALVEGAKSDYYFGYDGLGDNRTVEFSSIAARHTQAALALIELSKKYEGELLILSIGSLTNIALAIKLDCEFMSRLSQLYVAAGNIYSEKYSKPEFNAEMDVEAYHIVAGDGNAKKLTIVPFSQIRNDIQISNEWRLNVLGSIPTEIMQAQNVFEQVSIPKSKTWVLLDPAAMAVVLNQSVIVVETRYSDNSIHLCGENRGINTNIMRSIENSNSKLVYSVKENTYKQFLLDLFLAELKCECTDARTQYNSIQLILTRVPRAYQSLAHDTLRYWVPINGFYLRLVYQLLHREEVVSKISIMLFACLFMCFIVFSAQNESNERLKLVIDNDAGGDDAMAIFLALLNEEKFNGPQLVGLTTGNGNTNEDNVYINNQRILKVANRQDVPIFRGSKSSLVITPYAGAYYGEDGLGNSPIPDGLVPAKDQDAVTALIELSKKHNENLVVITIGTLTNVALAIKLDPGFLGRISHLYVGAGHIESEKNPDAEFNAHMDVEAYHIVAQYASPDKVTVFPFSQVKEHLNISKSWRIDVLGGIQTDIIKAQNMYESVVLAKEQDWAALDPAVVAVVVNPDLVSEYKYSKNDILLCGEKRGINTNIFVEKEDANVRMVYSVKLEEYKQFLLNVFAPSE
ncbi:uncharacterized protein [Epargyreus clarus]|uniref:uncharacterized protein n=1 Tax=Epargyreus clarus TaxID=520877 RepID=UPI003C2D6FB2